MLPNYLGLSIVFVGLSASSPCLGIIEWWKSGVEHQLVLKTQKDQFLCIFVIIVSN